jgi:hypothetical protein
MAVQAVTERHVCKALLTYERPIGEVQYYVVTCTCGWVSQHTSSWRKSLDSHFYRLAPKDGSA